MKKTDISDEIIVRLMKLAARQFRTSVDITHALGGPSDVLSQQEADLMSIVLDILDVPHDTTERHPIRGFCRDSFHEAYLSTVEGSIDAPTSCEGFPDWVRQQLASNKWLQRQESTDA